MRPPNRVDLAQHRLPEAVKALERLTREFMATCGVFVLADEDKAQWDALAAHHQAQIMEITHLGAPSLGCATTKQLIDELCARSQTQDQWELDRRTIDD